MNVLLQGGLQLTDVLNDVIKMVGTNMDHDAVSLHCGGIQNHCKDKHMKTVMSEPPHWYKIFLTQFIHTCRFSGNNVLLRCLLDLILTLVYISAMRPPFLTEMVVKSTPPTHAGMYL